MSKTTFFIVFKINYSSTSIKLNTIGNIVEDIEKCKTNYDFAMKLDEITKIIKSKLVERYEGVIIHDLVITNFIKCSK